MMPIPDNWRGTVPGSVRSALDDTTLKIAQADILSSDTALRNRVMYMIAKMVHYGGTRIQGLDIVRLSGTITQCFEMYPKLSVERNFLVAELLTHAKIAEKMVGSPELHCRYDFIRNDMESLARLYNIDCDYAIRLGLLLHLGIRELTLDDSDEETAKKETPPSPPAAPRPWGPARTALKKLHSCGGCGLFGHWGSCAKCNRAYFCSADCLRESHRPAHCRPLGKC